MSKLSISDVEHIAKLSKLELSLEEKKKFAKQLSSVIDYVNELKEVKSDNVEAISQVADLSNVAEKDEILKEAVSYQDIAKNAPVFEEGNFVVPQVFQD